MPSCCVPVCTNYIEKKKKIEAELGIRLSFHRFPVDKGLRKRWIHAIRRDEGPNFKVTKSTAVCSTHFTKEDYKWVPSGSQKLKKGAVPSVFSWTKPSKHRSPRKNRTPLPPLASTSNCTITSTSSSYAEPEPEMLEVPRPTSPQVRVESLNMHDYDVQPYTLQEKYEAALERIKELEKDLHSARCELKNERFSWEKLAENDQLVRFNTGFHSAEMFDAFFASIEPYAVNMITYTQHQRLTNDKTKVLINSAGGQKLSLKSQFFLFMHKMRNAPKDNDLADKFHVSQSTVSRIIITWANFLYCILGCQRIWPTKEQQEAHFPKHFPDHYKNVRVILDCTELKIQAPSSLLLNSELYSHYEKHTTLKGLVGITAWGAVCFVSSLYCGSISDIQITKESGVLSLLEEGDGVMADKGFVIEELLEEKGCKLIIPHFLEKRERFSAQENRENVEITNVRVHVERAIRRIKEYHIFDTILPLNLSGSINQIWSVCCMLTNFQGE